jgi:tRNA(Ile)-lysidine synthase
MRTHPPTLITLARRTIDDEDLAPRGARVLVAVSGGRDSMALLHTMARLAKACGFAIVAHGVDHGLRPAAAIELDLAERFAASLRVPFARTRVALDSGGNLQARARAARFEVLGAAARAAACDRIATAHHADDRAETVLLRLLRGAGPRGLAVLPPKSRAADGLLRIRPFIRARRAAIDAHVARHAIPFSEDPSNADPRFLRARVRAELLPLLERLSPSVVSHLCALADQLEAVPDGAPALPRATQDALAALALSRSPRARIALPGGLEARYAPPPPSRRRRPSL